MLQLACLAFFGWNCIKLDYDNRLERFAVEDHEAEERFRLFKRDFTADEHFLMVLRFREGQPMQQTGEKIFLEISQLPNIKAYHSYRELAGLSLSEAQLPFPFLDSRNRHYTAIFEVENQRRALMVQLDEVIQRLEQQYQAEISEIVVAGEPIVNESLNKSSLEVRNIFFPILIVCALFLLGVLFRCWKVVLVAGFAVGTSLVNTMGIMALNGNKMDLVTTLIPALIFVLSVAMQMHVLIAIAMEKCIETGLKRKLGPNFLVSLTTSIGFGSLMTSSVVPIAVMGKFMALGIWIIFFWSHITHLGLSQLIRLDIKVPPLALLERAIHSKAYRYGQRHPWLLAVAALVTLAGGLFLTYNPLESNGLNYFHESHPIRRQTTFLETYITGASQMELLIQKPEQDPATQVWIPDWQKLEDLEQKLKQLTPVRHIFSINQMVDTALAGRPNPGQGLDRGFVFAMIQQAQPQIASNFRSANAYRIQIIVNSLDRPAYLKLKEQLDLITSESDIQGNFVLTGTLDRLIEIQTYLLASLSRSLGLTVLSILVLMMVLLGRQGRLSLILTPNIFPLGMMALTMGLFGMKTTISTVMVFSIAFGIAVDDTIHLLHSWHHYEKIRCFRRRWRKTLAQDARAIMLTSLVLTAGFSVLIASSFIPTSNFGILMASGMLFAFIGDTLYLPILLRVFAARKLKKQRRQRQRQGHS